MSISLFAQQSACFCFSGLAASDQAAFPGGNGLPVPIPSPHCSVKPIAEVKRVCSDQLKVAWALPLASASDPIPLSYGRFMVSLCTHSENIRFS